MTEPLIRPAALPRTVWVLGFVSMLMDISSEMIHALLPLYLASVMGAPVAVIGLLEGVAEAVASFTKLFSGVLSDWLGRRKMLAALGYGLAAFTKPVFPMAGGISAIFAARFIDRIGKGLRGAPRDALVADVTPPDQRGAAFGLRQALDTTGAFLGPVLALGLMLATGDYKRVFWLAVIPAFGAFFLILLAVKEPERAAGPARSFPLTRKALSALPARFWAVLLLAGLFTLARFSEAFLILKAHDAGLSPALAPLVLIGMNLVYSLGAYPAGRVSDRPGGRRNGLGLSLVVLIAADLILCLPSLIAVAAGVMLWGLHMALSQGLLSALIADHAPAEWRGTAFGLFNLATGTAMLAASLIAGLLWDGFGPQATFLAGAGFAAASLVALYALVPGRGSHPVGR